MFEKQRLHMPTATSLRVGDLVLADARALDARLFTEGELEPIRKAWVKLQSYVTQQRPGTVVCANDTTVEQRYWVDFEAWHVNNPSKTALDFDLVYEPIYDDTDMDPRLGYLTFTVAEIGNGFAGLMHLYNIRIEEGGIDWEENGVVAQSNLQINASPSPSFTTRNGYLDPDELGLIMKAILETDIALADSEYTMDLIEWRFPTRESHAWVERAGGQLSHKALAHLVEHDRSDGSDGVRVVPSKIRRKAPPP